MLLNLARRHINASATDVTGMTPLHIACMRRNAVIVRLLLGELEDCSITHFVELEF
jgi:hypothetical protein